MVNRFPPLPLLFTGIGRSLLIKLFWLPTSCCRSLRLMVPCQQTSALCFPMNVVMPSLALLTKSTADGILHVQGGYQLPRPPSCHRLQESHIGPVRSCFLLSHHLPGRVDQVSLAKPGGGNVRVWGETDSLPRAGAWESSLSFHIVTLLSAAFMSHHSQVALVFVPGHQRHLGLGALMVQCRHANGALFSLLRRGRGRGGGEEMVADIRVNECLRRGGVS